MVSNPHESLATDRYRATEYMLSSLVPVSGEGVGKGIIDVGGACGRNLSILARLGIPFDRAFHVVPELMPGDVVRGRGSFVGVRDLFADALLPGGWNLMFANSIYFMSASELCKLCHLLGTGVRAFSYHHIFESFYTKFTDGDKCVGEALLRVRRSGARGFEEKRLVLEMHVAGNHFHYVHEFPSLLYSGGVQLPCGYLCLTQRQYYQGSCSEVAELLFSPLLPPPNRSIFDKPLSRYVEQMNRPGWRVLFDGFFSGPDTRSTFLWHDYLVFENDDGVIVVLDRNVVADVALDLTRRRNMADKDYQRRRCVEIFRQTYPDLPSPIVFASLRPLIKMVDEAMLEPGVRSSLGGWIWSFWALLCYACTHPLISLWWWICYAWRWLKGVGEKEWTTNPVAHQSKCFRQEYPMEYASLRDDCPDDFDAVDREDCVPRFYHRVFGCLMIQGEPYVGVNFSNCIHNKFVAFRLRNCRVPPVVSNTLGFSTELKAIQLEDHESPESIGDFVRSFPARRRAQYQSVLNRVANLGSEVGRSLARSPGSLTFSTMVKSNEIVLNSPGKILKPRTIMTPDLHFLMIMGPVMRRLSTLLKEYWDGSRAVPGTEIYPVYGPGRNWADFNAIMGDMQTYETIFWSDFSMFDLSQRRVYQEAVVRHFNTLVRRLVPLRSGLVRKVWMAMATRRINIFIELPDGRVLGYDLETFMASGRSDTSFMGTIIGLVIMICVFRRNSRAATIFQFGDDNISFADGLDVVAARDDLRRAGFEVKMGVEPVQGETLEAEFLGGGLFSEPTLHFAPRPGRYIGKLFQSHSVELDTTRLQQKLTALSLSSVATPVFHQIVQLCLERSGIRRERDGHPDLVKPYQAALPPYSVQDLDQFLSFYDIERAVYTDFLSQLPSMVQSGTFAHPILDAIFVKEKLC